MHLIFRKGSAPGSQAFDGEIAPRVGGGLLLALPPRIRYDFGRKICLRTLCQSSI